VAISVDSGRTSRLLRKRFDVRAATGAPPRCGSRYREASGVGGDSVSQQGRRQQPLAGVGSWRAPCKGGAFQRVQAPPGNRSSRKQPEQAWRWRNVWSLRV